MKIAILLLLLITTSFAQVANQLITISANGHYLYNSISGIPVYLTGDDAFLLATELCSSDVTTYLNDRQARGYNAIWVAPVDNVYSIHPPTNCNGDSPFTGADFGTFNSTYWSYVDSVISAASARGITVFFNPAFVGVNSAGGWFNDFTGAGTSGCCSGTVWTTYGTTIGNRYKNFNNIVWLLGGDADLTNSTIKTNIGLLATAIAVVDTNHLFTLEACRSCNGNPGNDSSITSYSGSPPSWLNINWSYDQQGKITTANGCPLTYTQSSTILPMEGEMWYELENGPLTGANTRAEGYWSTLTGCFLGSLFGNGQIWGFSSPNTGNGTTPNWTTQLGSVGSVGEQYMGQLMRSRRHWLMVPDASNAVLTGGISSGLTISVAACASDGSTCIVYDQSGSTNPPQIAMGHFSSTVHAWWYNPSTSVTTDLGTFTNSGTHTFTPSDTNDWVLVLDLNSLNFRAPGISGVPGTALSGIQIRGVSF